MLFLTQFTGKKHTRHKGHFITNRIQNDHAAATYPVALRTINSKTKPPPNLQLLTSLDLRILIWKVYGDI